MRKSNSLYRPPVIVATFANGEHVRMSFFTPLPRPGKPIAWRFAQARRMVCDVIGNERERAASWNGLGLAPFGRPAVDLVECWIEHDGAIIEHAATILRPVPAIAVEPIPAPPVIAAIPAPPVAPREAHGTPTAAPLAIPTIIPAPPVEPIPAPPMAMVAPQAWQARKPGGASRFDRVMAELLNRRAA